MTKAIDSSCVGQKMIEAGTQASGGIGRTSSNTGKAMPRKVPADGEREAEGNAEEHRGGEAAEARAACSTYQLCQ